MQNIDFRNIPLFSGLDRISLARLIPRLVKREAPEATLLVAEGDPGDCLYVIVSGLAKVYRLDGGEERELAILGAGDCFGEMSLLRGEPRSASVSAHTDLVLFQLTRENFDDLLRRHHSLGVHLAEVLAGRLAQAYTESSSLPHPAATLAGDTPVPPSSSGFAAALLQRREMRAVLLTLVGVLLAYPFLSRSGLPWRDLVLLELLLGATIAWGCNAFSYHAVAVSLPVLTVLCGAAGAEKAFAGFSSPSWFLVLGVFAVSAAISRTGLLYRLVLLMVHRFPRRYGAQTFALALAGLLLTPVIPSSNGRAVLSGPLVLNICEALGFSKDSPGAVGMGMATLLGFGHMSFMFMNGTATCFLALGLLPKEAAASISWGSWAFYALPLGIAYFAVSILLLLFMYRPVETKALPPEVIEAQLKALGKMTRKEKISLWVVVFSLLGFVTEPLHGINGAWVAMVSFLLLFVTSVLDEGAVRRDIDWNFLISFGALIGFGGVISASSIPGAAAASIGGIIGSITTSGWLFLPLVALTVYVLRLSLPLPAGLLVSILVFTPIAGTLGIHPFVIALVALVASNPFFVPFQNAVYQNFLESTEGKLFSHVQARRYSWAQLAAVLTAVVLSIPVWRLMGLIQ
ncbi:MAG: ABC-type branched-chain amino acid transport system periplasmic [Geobacteraceae bacterium]|nr:MAG: ABC-type branched-chain amino acid transport system periplasmic [Geobacteraceae bacterium]